MFNDYFVNYYITYKSFQNNMEYKDDFKTNI